METVGMNSNPKHSEVRELERNLSLEKRINDVCEFIINNKCSYRQAAAEFKVSVATVSDYCERFAKMNPERYKELEKIIKSNTVSKTDGKKILEQARLVIEGKTLDEIAALYGTSSSTVSRNVKNRLKEVDINLYNEVAALLKSRSKANLNRGTKK